MGKLVNLKKVLIFGLLGAGGGFIGAILGEMLLAFTLPSPKPPLQVDVLFVLDVTGSMDKEIAGVRRGIQDFVSEFSSQNMDARVGLIAFRDRLAGEEPQILSFSGQAFTSDTDSFSREVGKLQASGGGDDPESSLDAVVLAAQQPLRENAEKVILLITDAPPKIPDRETPSIEEAERILYDHKISQLHLVVQNNDSSAFAGLRNRIPGKFFSLAKTATRRQAFEQMLPGIATAIRTGSIIRSKTVDSTNRFWSLIITTGLWTSMLAIGVFLLLAMGQNRYLHRALLTVRQGIVGAGGSLLGGFGAGVVGQLFYGGVAIIAVLQLLGRIVAWAILGALLGRGMAFFVPNLKPNRAQIGGGLGGFVGAVGFLWAAAAFGDIAGRFMGAAILGFFIGLMIVLVEVAFREAWLEISYGPKENRTVSLGLEPVSIGNDPKACTIYARDVLPVAFRYKLEQDHIVCEDVASGYTNRVEPGDCKVIGNITVSVRAVGKAAQPVPTAPVSPGRAGGFLLRVSSGRTIQLSEGIRLSPTDIPGLKANIASETVAEVSQHPNDPTILGLKNLSNRSWDVTVVAGDRRQIEPGRSIRLAIGTKIDFGSVTGEICR